jgi:tripartite-type tricarboxylate transporter receptor subunit TctC
MMAKRYLQEARLMLVAGIMAAGVASAQPYPAKPVRLIVPFAPGAAQDLTGRLVAQKLSEGWPQQVIVDNRPGAGSSIGAQMVARAAPDGFTLLLGNEALAINASLGAALSFDPLRDFAPISLVVINPRLFVVHPSISAESMRDIIASAKAKPGSIRYGSSGVGTGGHLAGALLAIMSSTEMTHVPYKGAAPAMTDVVGGQIELVAATIMSAVPFLQSGRLRPVAVTSPQRSSVLPQVPTVAESGLPGYEAIAWSMLLAPAKTPPAIIAKVQKDTARFLEQPEVKARLLREGAENAGWDARRSADYLRAEVARWAKVVREAGVKAGD